MNTFLVGTFLAEEGKSLSFHVLVEQASMFNFDL